MEESKQILPPELVEAQSKAWSFPGAKKPTGEYVGAVRFGEIFHYYYKDGEKYWCESDFDRQMREKDKQRRRAEYQNGTNRFKGYGKSRGRRENMNQVIITISAGPSNYWAKLDTEHDGRCHEKKIERNRKSTANSNLLQAAIDALKALNRPCMLDISTCQDGSYLSGAVRNGWLTEWQRNGWKTAKGETIKNREQWKELSALMARHSIRFVN